MSDNFSPRLALAGAGVCAVMGVWPMALLFLVAALVFSMTLGAQDEANKQAIQTQDPTPARTAYGFGLVVAVIFFVLAILLMGSFTVTPWRTDMTRR